MGGPNKLLGAIIVMTRVIGIASGKGGVGKTTISTNLGCALSQRLDKDVIIVDCNVTTSHLGLHLGMYFYPTTFNDALRGKAKIETAIYEHFSGIRVIPASLSLDDMQGVDVVKIKKQVRKLDGTADIILLDSAPGMGREAMAALDACNEIIFVTTPHIPSLTDIIRSKTVAEEHGIEILGVVINMSTGGGYELTPKEIEKLVELPVLANIPYDKKVLRSLNDKMPLVMAYPGSKPSRQFTLLAETITGEKAPDIGIFDRLKEAILGPTVS